VGKKSKEDPPKAGAPAWMATYGDMVTLLLCFFVLLFSMSSVDIAKFKAAMSSFADQIDVLPGGEALTDGELLSNGISQLNDIQVTFSGGMALNTEGDTISPVGEDDDTKDKESTSDSETTSTTEDPYKLAGEIAQEFNDQIVSKGYEGEVEITYTANYIKFTLEGEYLFDSGRANLKTDAVELISAISAIIKKEAYKDYDVQIEGHTDNLSINSTQFPNNWILSSYRAFAVLDQLIKVHGFDPEKVAATGYGEFRPIKSNDTAEGRAANRRVEIKVILDTKEKKVEEGTVD
jgi:chemotaxis protein MotB